MQLTQWGRRNLSILLVCSIFYFIPSKFQWVSRKCLMLKKLLGRRWRRLELLFMFSEWNISPKASVETHMHTLFYHQDEGSFRSISMSSVWWKTMYVAWEPLLKHCFAASLLFWLTFIIFKTNRIKALFKIFKCSSILKHMPVSWQLDANSLQCYNRRQLTQN